MHLQVCLCFAALLFAVEVIAPNLELVQILFRHGDRTPLTTFPNDPHNDIWAARGLGQLTNLGKQQQLELGEYIRSRYSTFFNSTYNWHEITVQSTDVDRTLMSAQANLAGLYPPMGDDIWNRTILWQPIPVHTVPRASDYLLKLGFENCPRYKEITDDIMNSPEVQGLLNDYRDLLQMVTNESGMSVDSLKAACDIYDTLFIEKIYNLSLPHWVTNDVYAQLGQLSDLDFTYQTHTEEQRRLTGGPLLKAMLANAKAKIDDVSSQQKLYVYSAHDTTVANLLSALNVFDGVGPSYTATVFVELLRLFNSSYALQFLYHGNTSKWNDAPQVLILPGCSAPCLLDRVIELTKGVLPDDVAQECRATSTSNIPWTVVIIVVALTVVFVGTLLVGFMYQRRRKRTSTSDYRYTIVSED